MLVSGDHHLLDLGAQLPVCSAADFLASIGEPELNPSRVYAERHFPRSEALSGR